MRNQLTFSTAGFAPGRGSAGSGRSAAVERCAGHSTSATTLTAGAPGKDVAGSGDMRQSTGDSDRFRAGRSVAATIEAITVVAVLVFFTAISVNLAVDALEGLRDRDAAPLVTVVTQAAVAARP